MMSWKLHLVIAVAFLLPAQSEAQRGGGHGFGGRTGGGTFTTATRPEASRSFEGRGSGQRGGLDDYYGYSGLGWLDDLYYGDYANPVLYGGYPAQPDLLFPGVYRQSPPIEPPSSPVVHEYHWPASEPQSATAFAIVSKDGRTQTAIAVWVQEGSICFITPDGLSRRLLLAEVDRGGTERANAARNLKLPLPSGE